MKNKRIKKGKEINKSKMRKKSVDFFKLFEKERREKREKILSKLRNTIKIMLYFLMFIGNLLIFVGMVVATAEKGTSEITIFFSFIIIFNILFWAYCFGLGVSDIKK